MNRKGFTLIEVLIAATIAVVLGSVITMILFQLNRLQPVLERHIYPSTTALFLYQQLFKDLSGAQIPVTQWLALAQQSQKTANPSDQEKAPQKESYKIPLISKLFIGTTKDGQLDTLSFITTNPLQPYWGSKSGKYIPRAVRVVYRLREDKNAKTKEKRYVLLRQESEHLDLDKVPEADPKSWPSYTIADHIKSCKVEYIAAIEQPAPPEAPSAKPGTSTPSTPKTTYEIKTYKEWQERKPPTEKKASESQEPLLPQVVKMELSVYNPAGKHSLLFSLVLPIYTQQIYPQTQKSAAPPPKLTDIIKKLTNNTFPEPAQPNTPTIKIGHR
jgi:prepilin-type N-terminal cleavage/methylation domain-containing protein